MKAAVYLEKKRKRETGFKKEDDFEKFVVDNSKIIFGDKSVYIDTKKRIKGKTLGAGIPDGYLINFTDNDNPEFYIVESELAKHDFYNHIFKQVTKFLAFYRTEESRIGLVNAVWTAVNEDPEVLEEIKSKIKDPEVYRFLKVVTDDSQNILIVIDDEKKEFHEIQQTYTDTWDKKVKIIIVKNYGPKKNGVITVIPPFEQIDFEDAPAMEEEDIGIPTRYTEEYHMEGISQEIKDVYFQLRFKMLKMYPNLLVNYRKYYISFKDKKNFGYLQFRKRKIRVVVLLEEERVREIIKRHKVVHLSQGSQDFWNGPSCEIIVENIKHYGDIIKVLKKAKEKQN